MDNMSITKENVISCASMRHTDPYRMKQNEGGVYWTEDDCTVDIDFSNDEYLVFKVYPGILVPPAFYVPVTKYCLEHTSTTYSWFKIDNANGELACISSFPVPEYPLGFLTIYLVVDLLLDEVRKHRTALLDLSYGRTVRTYDKVQPKEYEELVNSFRRKAQIAVIRDYMNNTGHHGFYAESSDADGNPSWQVELGYGEDDQSPLGFHTYTLHYNFSNDGFLKIGASIGKQGIMIESEYEEKIMNELLRLELEDETGNFCIGQSCPGITYQRRISYIDGIITEKTLSEIDEALIKTLQKNWRRLETAAHGMEEYYGDPEPPEEKETADIDEEELPFS